MKNLEVMEVLAIVALIMAAFAAYLMATIGGAFGYFTLVFAVVFIYAAARVLTVDGAKSKN